MSTDGESRLMEDHDRCAGCKGLRAALPFEDPRPAQPGTRRPFSSVVPKAHWHTACYVITFKKRILRFYYCILFCSIIFYSADHVVCSYFSAIKLLLFSGGLYEETVVDTILGVPHQVTVIAASADIKRKETEQRS